MIDGITVLAETVVIGSSNFGICFILFALGLCFILFAFFIGSDLDSIWFIILPLAMGFVFLISCHEFSKNTQEYKYTKYQVTISDGVKFKNFDDRYKVLSHEGEIYTIVEREEYDGN